MDSAQQLRNAASWHALIASIREHPDNDYWILWKQLAMRFVQKAVDSGLNNYFRAGRSMNHLVFSTLDRNGLRDEPRVTIVIRTKSEIQIAYGNSNRLFGSPELEYTLPLEEGFSTFRRFLHQLWTATISDPIPEEMRGPINPISCAVFPTIGNGQFAESVLPTIGR